MTHMRHDRFIYNRLSKFQEANQNPIFDYDDSPVLTLEEAVKNIILIVPDAADYVSEAKENCNRNTTLLTWDESATIYLYSMPVSFFSRLNTALRDENRRALKPWSAFLKLFITALEKLPSTEATIWRGVNYDATLTFVDNDVHTWWNVNSCSMDPNIVQSFLGDSGTLFVINAIHGKDISMFSAIPSEREVLLMPGTRVRRKYESLNFMDRLFVLHLEEINSQCKSQTESNYLFELIKQTYRHNNRIERIMNPAKYVPIEQSYINLAIVKAKEQHEKEKQLRGAQHSNDIMGTFEEIYGMKSSIDVKDIFETCKNQEKQVLVFGRAGIGKSTFCRYVAYQWATGSYWPQYEVVALIPLRRLTANRYPPLSPGQSYSLIDLVKKEVFSYDLSEKDDKLLKNQLDTNKTLWILDGYDEVVQNVPIHLEYLFEQLLKTPYHILTSRPYLNTLSYDVQLEIIGFTDQNIKQYVQQFFEQMSDELDNALIKSQKLLSFLASNPSIWGVAHIPVNLELICSLWSNEDWSETEQLTMTTLYSLMTEWLCRRYLRTQDNQILQLSKEDIDRWCQKELAFLEILAFNAMKSNTIIIRPPLLKKALYEAKLSLQEHPHILNIGIFKSFNKQGIGNRIETDKDHYFVHLSFQEYFAARYLVSTLKGSTTEETIEFIKNQKYNQRYTLVFTFASGLLSETDAKPCLNIFWDNILKEPLDLVGIRHMQLVISCIEETSDKLTPPRRAELLQWIAKCIKFNFSTENDHIRKHLFQSLQKSQSVANDQTIINVFINLLQCNDPDTKATALSFVSELKISNPSAALITSMTTRLNDESDQVRENACKALGKIGEKAAKNEVISKLVSALGDNSQDVRRNACKALKSIGEKAETNELISKLVSALGHESAYIRANACEVLGNVSEKAATNAVISKLVNALGDESRYVRANVCEALGKVCEKSATHEVINKLVSALEDDSQDVRRNACKALENIAEKAETNELIRELVSAIGHESAYVRANVCKALGNVNEKSATIELTSILVSALGDESRYVIANVCEALGKICEKAATNEMISKLVSALGHKSVYVRANVCEALGNLSEKATTNAVISKLLSALDDENGYVRKHACKALGKICEKAATDEVISKLVSALGHESACVRANVCEALGNVSEKAATNVVISKLVSALGDESGYVREYASKTLGKIGTIAATNEAISKLVSALEDENEYVRRNACVALWRMGEKAVTDEVISKLVNRLEDESKDVRLDAYAAFGKMGEKAATDEVIHKLVSALESESTSVRTNACYTLGMMGEKAATNEVINKLVNALESESRSVRQYACKALAGMGEKAGTNEVIHKLVSALADESEDVRASACVALGKMGEKSATNEVIGKLGTIINNDGFRDSYSASNAVESILSSSAVITQLDPTIISYFCLSKYGSNSIKNVPVDELMNVFFIVKNPSWLPVVTHCSLREGVAMVAAEDKIIVYSRKEPLEILVPSLELRQQLIEAFIDQGKRLHLFLEIPSEAQNKS